MRMKATAPPDPRAIAKGWSAKDVDPSELVDDDWIAANTAPGKRPSTARHAAARTLQLLNPKTPRSLQRQALTRDQMRRIAARTGYPYTEAWSGWNRGAMKGVWGALVHHTGTAWTTLGDYPTLKVVRDGRPGLENSLCAFGLGRSGRAYLVSEKLSWHAGEGEWNGLTDGNGFLAGIEAESDGVHWTDEQRDAYPRLVASILVEIGQGDEYTTRHASFALPRGRKTDAGGLDMDAFWNQVYFYLAHREFIDRNYRPTVPEVKTIVKELKDMTVIITASSDDTTKRAPALLSGLGGFIGLGTQAEVDNAKKVLPEIWVEPYTWDALAQEKKTVLDGARAAVETVELQKQILAALQAKSVVTNPPA